MSGTRSPTGCGSLSDGAADPAGKVAALLGVREVFPAELAVLRDDLAAAYSGRAADGARAAGRGSADEAAPLKRPAPEAAEPRRAEPG